ncbi:hypothetical protein Tco_0858058 [Tanacetum coccineum]|uniref:Ty3 transposon capsid-like protein domain-containing protein n=1 Tax=Tanacetum coccineum TaxID=301880 RepID=A0ABQ5B7Y8_9ASTR
MTITRSGMTPAAIKEMINRRVDTTLEARRVNRYLELGNGNDNRGDGNGGGDGTGNGNNGGDDGDGNENRNVNGRGDRPGARECTYQDFMKCQPLSFKGTEGVVGFIRWSEKMETVFHISNYPERYQVNHGMQKLESKLWNHAMVRAGHAAYTNRFHELARLVPHLVTSETWMIERYAYGLAPQIRRMVAATEPKTIQKAVQISSALTDEAVRNESIKKVEKRGNVGEPSKDKNCWD